MNDINYYDALNDAIKSLKAGAFLTAVKDEHINPMTIAWGMFGFIWSKPIVQVLIRDSRYTKGLVDQTNEFTISFPLQGQLKDALRICGTKSGRDMDKMAVCGLKAIESQSIHTPIIDGCDLYVECKVVAKQRMTKDNMIDASVIDCYKNNDFHTLYYGEVLRTYTR